MFDTSELALLHEAVIQEKDRVDYISPKYKQLQDLEDKLLKILTPEDMSNE